jgi:threonine aldolase|tara:strand:- start:328 stop:1380 length:1053 start_codon:yes stop_codon:yes gene_type:complete
MALIDLRSDTVTKPTDEMRRAMAEAEVGDDVYGEDPSVNELQERSAALLGHEAGLLTSSGTMGNLLATLTYCNPGDEIVMGDQAHMFWNEGGGQAALAGVQTRLIPQSASGGIDADDVARNIRPAGNPHVAATKIVCLENTQNRCSGMVMTPAETKAVCDVAHGAGVAVHLDGARIFNAAVALEVPVAELTRDVDDASFCLSKALSCPVGSVLVGSKDFIQEATRWRKMVGGGSRQAGILAAAGLVALDTMIDRLAEDHQNARRLAAGLANIDGLSVDADSIQTNIVIFDIDEKVGAVPDFITAMKDADVLVSYPGEHSVRMVTHRHISGDDVEEALSRTSKVVRKMQSS